LFAAVWPPPEVRRRLEALAVPVSPRLRAVRPDRWHVTLAFYGDVDDDAALVSGLAAAAASVGPATAVVGPSTERLGRQVLYLAVGGLDEVATAVRRETAASMVGDERRFTGHLTLARARGKSTVPVAAVGLPFSATFDVTQLSLIESQLTSEGPVYRDRVALSLGGAPPTMTQRG
jgi:2'-5' RNA ligase